MALIYLSSTFSDLETHRRAVFDQLTRMRHQVRAMEHYGATDERPAAECIKDVHKSDLYIGLFAWRGRSMCAAPSLPRSRNWKATIVQ